jgi:L-aspartate oxidase
MGAAERIDVDVAVVGAGAAGLSAAITAADAGASVAVISATPLAQTASYWAQGGLAAALALDDSPQLHLQDTERAGRALVRRSAAEVLTNEAPEMILALQHAGVTFDADRYGNLSLGLEGGHSRRRIVHAGGSATGRRVARQLSADLVSRPNVLILELTRAADLWVDDGRVVGVLCEDELAVRARGTVIAAGGAAALWRRTTNPPGSQGTGLLLAQRAGAAIADLEFVQFHPTAVTGIAGREGFLVTEAIRGEGATIVGPDGERFVEELAPRDEVSRAIWEVMDRTGAPSVRLDMRAVDPARFPNVVEALRKSGLDPAAELIPIAPAAHYVMGGVKTDLHGSAGVPGLYVVGESACTGLHGANRLASNSLSECAVFGARAARAALDEPAVVVEGEPPAAQPIVMPERSTQEAMWRDAGLVRDREGLERLLDDPHPLARLVARCALEREETRGAHVRRDFPETDPALDLHHVVVRGDDHALELWR